MSDILDLQQHTADRLSTDRRFLAWHLRQYGVIEQIASDDVAGYLGISPSDLSRLALCTAPDPAESDFSSRIQNIAVYTGANAAQLAQLVRFANIYSKQLAKVVPLTNTFPGMLLAAREKETSANEQERPNDGNQ